MNLTLSDDQKEEASLGVQVDPKEVEGAERQEEAKQG